MISPRMRWVLPEIVWAGISLAIYTGLLVTIISKTVEGTGEELMRSMYAMICLGIGEIVGSFVVGQVIDRKGSKVTSYLTVGLILLQTVLMLWFIGQNTYGLLVFVLTFVFGFQDAVVNTHMSELLGFEFLPDNVRPFAVFNIVQSMTVFTFLVIEAYVDTLVELAVFNVICGLSGAAMCAALLWFPFRHKETANI